MQAFAGRSSVGRTGSFVAARSGGRASLPGREVQFADGDSGRSINLDKRRRTQCRLQAPERSLNRTDWRRADDCYGAHTVHRGSRRHRQQPLRRSHPFPLAACLAQVSRPVGSAGET